VNPALQGEADAALAQAEAHKLLAGREDLTVWPMEKVKQSRKGSTGPMPTGSPPGVRATRHAMCTWEAAGRWMARRPCGRPWR